MPRDHAHTLVDPGDHIVRRAGLQESDAVLAASRQDAITRRLHFHRVGLAWNRPIAERKTQVAWADLGKSQPWHSEDRLAIGDAFRGARTASAVSA